MLILSRWRRKHNRLDQPVLASRQQRRVAAKLVALDLPYLTAREWIDISNVSGRTFSFATLHHARGYGPDHPWRWRITSTEQRHAAQRLQMAGIVAPLADDPLSVQLTLEGFLRVMHGTWGHSAVGVMPLTHQ